MRSDTARRRSGRTLAGKRTSCLCRGDIKQRRILRRSQTRVYGRYQEALHANNAMDFDDLLTKTAILLHDNLELRAKYQQKWQYLLVDEFQDTNTAQYELLRLMANEPEGRAQPFCRRRRGSVYLPLSWGRLPECKTFP